jgi:hypothetical protein
MFGINTHPTLRLISRRISGSPGVLNMGIGFARPPQRLKAASSKPVRHE